MEGIRAGCEQGLYGWNVTQTVKSVLGSNLYYSPVSTPADFQCSCVLEQVLKKRNRIVKNILDFKIYAPQEYLSRSIQRCS